MMIRTFILSEYSLLNNFMLSVKESLGLEKKTAVSKALAESSNFGKTKPNFRFCPDAPGWLHLPGTYHHLSRGFNTPCPTTNAISTKEYPKHPT